MEVSIGDTLELSNLRELGSEAVISISSAKPGNGVEQLRDDNLETFWQSDGTAPHLINIQFLRRAAVSKICFYVDYSTDESYTAKKVSIRSGTSQHDLVDLTAIELHEPVGWCQISLTSPESDRQPLRTHLLQLRIMSMHQNGRDTHIRQLKILGPRIPVFDNYKTPEMLQYSHIR